MENRRKDQKILDTRKMVKTIFTRKKMIIRNLVISFLLSCIWIFPEPRYYTSEVSVAPETASDNIGGGLSAIAATFGMSLGGSQNDAIYPMLYPELFQNNEFIVDIFDIEVQTDDGEVKCDYYTYMKSHQKHNLLTYPFRKAFTKIKKMTAPKKKKLAGSGDYNGKRINPFIMSEEDFNLIEKVKKNIICSVDKKTDVATIIVKDQDPLICATLADSIRILLQDFIITYRTSKARMDVEHYTELASKAKADYDEAVNKYSSFVDSHKNSVLQAIISERNELENDMSIKFNIFNAMNSQLQSAAAKLQERTPAFTTLKCASVPVKPAGPKRMIFVFGMVLLTFIGTSIWVCRREIFEEAN